ncbi:MAG: hypothetical protein AB7P56_06120 [Nitrososphaeraceae archaeon]
MSRSRFLLELFVGIIYNKLDIFVRSKFKSIESAYFLNTSSTRVTTTKALAVVFELDNSLLYLSINSISFATLSSA